MRWLRGLAWIVLVVSLTAPAAGNRARPFEVGSARIVLSGSRYGVDGLPVEVRFPIVTGGVGEENVFPLIVFGHGFQHSFRDYAYLWEALVPQGYVMAFPDRLATSGYIPLDAYAHDLLFVAQALRESGADPLDRLYGRIVPSTAFMGHSTGGAAVLVALASRPVGDTAVLLAPLGNLRLAPVSGTCPISAAEAVSASVLVVDAAEDCLTPPEGHSAPIFGALERASARHRITLLQGDHCGFSDAGGPAQAVCRAAERARCLRGFPPVNVQGPTMGAAAQNAMTARYVLGWLEHHLRGCEEALAHLTKVVADDPGARHVHAP